MIQVLVAKSSVNDIKPTYEIREAFERSVISSALPEFISLKLSQVCLCCNADTKIITDLASAVCNLPCLAQGGYAVVKSYNPVLLNYRILVPVSSCAISCMLMLLLKTENSVQELGAWF